MPDVNDYLSVKQQALDAMRAKLSSGDVAPTALSATARVAGASGVRPVQVREFTVVTDSAPALAGYNLGPSAPELLLSSLASCLAHTYLIVAASHGVPISSLEVVVQAEIDFRGALDVDPEVPSPPQNIRYTAQLGGGATPDQLAFLQREVERLCPVLRALTEPVAVTGRVVAQH
jgi:uncharacterized OsmC-like protein